MGCNVAWGLVQKYDIGVRSEKPKVGRGNGGSYGYSWWFRERDPHVGHARLTPTQVKFLFERMEANNTRIDANILWIRDRDDNMLSSVNYHLFIRSQADSIIFKMYFSELPEDMTFSSNKRVQTPSFYMRRS